MLTVYQSAPHHTWHTALASIVSNPDQSNDVPYVTYFASSFSSVMLVNLLDLRHYSFCFFFFYIFLLNSISIVCNSENCKERKAIVKVIVYSIFFCLFYFQCQTRQTSWNSKCTTEPTETGTIFTFNRSKRLKVWTRPRMVAKTHIFLFAENFISRSSKSSDFHF